MPNLASFVGEDLHAGRMDPKDVAPLVVMRNKGCLSLGRMHGLKATVAKGKNRLAHTKHSNILLLMLSKNYSTIVFYYDTTFAKEHVRNAFFFFSQQPSQLAALIQGRWFAGTGGSTA